MRKNSEKIEKYNLVHFYIPENYKFFLHKSKGKLKLFIQIHIHIIFFLFIYIYMIIFHFVIFNKVLPFSKNINHEIMKFFF